MSRWDTDAFAQKEFVRKLELLEKTRTNLWSEYEEDFIKHMRLMWDSREDADDLGLRRWEPSHRQLNYLDSLVRKL